MRRLLLKRLARLLRTLFEGVDIHEYRLRQRVLNFCPTERKRCEHEIGDALDKGVAGALRERGRVGPVGMCGSPSPEWRMVTRLHRALRYEGEVSVSVPLA